MPIGDIQQEAISDAAHNLGYLPDTPTDWSDPKPKTVGDALNSQAAVGLKNVIEDLTPQLGGNLDVNGKTIGNVLGNLGLMPNAEGDVILFAVTSIADGVDGKELRIWRKGTTNGYLRLYVSAAHVSMIHSDHSIVMQVAAGRYIKLNSKDHLYLDLGDTVGVKELRVRDSASVKRATINSDGEGWFDGSVGFTIRNATGDGTTTINWKQGNKFNFTWGAFDETFAFTAPTKPGNFVLKMKQDATGGRNATMAAVTWLGTVPVFTAGGANKTIIVTLYYDGVAWWGQATPWEA